MSRYSLLHPGYCLRGWIGFPHALVRGGKVIRLNRTEFNTLVFCDGHTDLETLPIPKMGEVLSELEEKGFIQITDQPQGELAPEQYYKHFDNRFVNSVYWSITGRCNFECRHCYINAPDAEMGEMSHEEAIEVINQIAECGVYRLLISGGEPFVRSDFWSLVDHALSKGIIIEQIYTNGWMLTEEVLDQFCARGIKPEFSISFDGVGWHDWMRGVKGAEEVTLEALRRCHRRGFSTSVEMCIHRGNMERIRESINLLAKTGTRSVKCSEVSPTDLWRCNSDGNDISIREYFDAVLRYIPYYYEDGMPVDVLFGGVVKLYKHSAEYQPIAEFDEGSEECLDRFICGAVRSSCYIAPDGRLLPCMPVASVPDQSLFPRIQDIGLKAALTDSYVMEFANRRVKDLLEVCRTCRECPHHLKCGGCRANAVMDGEHDLMGPDPSRCLMWKGGYLEKLHEVCDISIAKH